MLSDRWGLLIGNQEESNWNERNARHHSATMRNKQCDVVKSVQNNDDFLFPNLQFQHMLQHLHIYLFYKFRLGLCTDCVLILECEWPRFLALFP